MSQSLHAAGPVVCARAPRSSRRSALPSKLLPCAARRRALLSPFASAAALPRRSALAGSAVVALASRSSAAAAAVRGAAASAAPASDLLIVGPGVLGSMVGALWLQARRVLCVAAPSLL